MLDRRFKIFADEKLSVDTPYHCANQYIVKSMARIEKTIQCAGAGVFKDKAVLDIGASPFYFVYRVLQMGACSATGVYHTSDFHPFDNLEKTYCRFGTINLCNVDVLSNALPFADASFDVISCFEVLEHFPVFPDLLLSEITRVSKKDATVLITVPNVATLKNSVKLLLGKNIYMPYKTDPSGRHVHEYVKSQLLAIMRAMRLSDVKVRTINTSRLALRMESNRFGKWAPVESLLNASLFGSVIFASGRVNESIALSHIDKPRVMYSAALANEGGGLECRGGDKDSSSKRAAVWCMRNALFAYHAQGLSAIYR